MRLSTTIPSLPVEAVPAAAEFYADRLGFEVVHVEAGFARLRRDDAEIHLWASDDASWRTRTDLTERPVVSGAESFLAGTASCRVEVDDVDALYAELAATAVLHYGDRGAPVDTDYGTREFHCTDLAGNLLTFYRWT
jgi:catechol 2,3-dioxygenase-like lactoylglutathione lyase family enzyme